MSNHDEFSVEKTEPSNKSIFIWGVLVAIFFFGSGLAVRAVFRFYHEKEIYKKVLSVPDQERISQIEREERILAGKPLVSDNLDHKILPIEYAMHRVVDESVSLAKPVQGSTLP